MNDFIPRPRPRTLKLEAGELAYLDAGARHRHPVVVLCIRGQRALVQMLGGSCWWAETANLTR